MQTIAFIGVGHMGNPMAVNLIKAGYKVIVYDVVPELITQVVKQGAHAATSIADAVKAVDIVITMLPESKHVVSAYTGNDGILAAASTNTLLIDCSTIDVTTSREIHDRTKHKGFAMLDAPVSGGTAGAAAGTLTFMVGGAHFDFERAQPILKAMGKKIFFTGAAGNGQATKICNNLLLGISMIGTCEAFQLAEKLGLDAQTFFDVCSVSSGQNWSLTSYCPVPGPVPASPANHDYQAGFMAKMMLKDLHLAEQAATSTHANTPLTTVATTLYTALCNAGLSEQDFSVMMEWLRAPR